jgi:hypothetical protein
MEKRRRYYIFMNDEEDIEAAQTAYISWTLFEQFSTVDFYLLWK